MRLELIIFKKVRIYSLNTFPYAKTFLFYIVTCLIFAKRKSCIGIRPIDSRLYFVNSCSPMSCLICDYLRSTRYLLIVLREYTLKVHVLASSEHTLSRVIYALITLISSIITIGRLLDKSDQQVQHGFYSRTFNNM